MLTGHFVCILIRVELKGYALDYYFVTYDLHNFELVELIENDKNLANRGKMARKNFLWYFRQGGKMLAKS